MPVDVRVASSSGILSGCDGPSNRVPGVSAALRHPGYFLRSLRDQLRRVLLGLGRDFRGDLLHLIVRDELALRVKDKGFLVRLVTAATPNF